MNVMIRSGQTSPERGGDDMTGSESATLVKTVEKNYHRYEEEEVIFFAMLNNYLKLE